MGFPRISGYKHEPDKLAITFTDGTCFSVFLDVPAPEGQTKPRPGRIELTRDGNLLVTQYIFAPTSRSFVSHLPSGTPDVLITYWTTVRDYLSQLSYGSDTAATEAWKVLSDTLHELNYLKFGRPDHRGMRDILQSLADIVARQKRP